MGIVANQSIKGTIATYLGVAIGFFTNFFLITKYLSAEQIGFLTNVLINTATLFAQFSLFGVSNSIIRFFPFVQNKSNKNNGFFFWTTLIPFISYLIVFFVFFLFNDRIVQFFVEKSPLFANYYLAVLPLSFFLLYITIFEAHANVLMRVAIPRFVREVVIRICMLLFYFLYIKGVITFEGLINCQCLTYAIAALSNFAFLLFLKQISFKPCLDYYKKNKPLVWSFVKYSFYLFVTTIAIALSPTLINLFISARIGEYTTGVYTIAMFIAALVNKPSMSVHPILAPQISKNIKDNKWKKVSSIYNQGSSNLLIIVSFICLCIWINVDLIYTILPNGHIYAEGKNALFVLCVFNIVQATLGNVPIVFNYSKYYTYTLFLSLGHAVFSVSLANVLVVKFGIVGAAMSNLVSYLVYYLVIIAILYKLTNFSPFSSSMLKTILLFFFILLANSIIQHQLTDINVWCSSILRSILLLSAYALVVYKFKFSEELNEVVIKHTKNIVKKYF